jgi:hypothetical protein
LEISLTDFVDFTLKTGSSRVVKVKEIKGRGDYLPAADYWKGFREGVVALHRSGRMSAAALDRLVAGQSNASKARRYADAAAGYKRFIGKRPPAWFPPPPGRWIEGDLEVRVNPELGLTIDGVPTFTKLYFKSDSPTRSRVQAVLAVIDVSMASASPGSSVAVLDVSSGRLMRPDGRWNKRDMETLLAAEAGAFVEIWNRV